MQAYAWIYNCKCHTAYSYIVLLVSVFMQLSSSCTSYRLAQAQCGYLLSRGEVRTLPVGHEATIHPLIWITNAHPLPWVYSFYCCGYILHPLCGLFMSTAWTCAVTTDTDQWYFQLMPPSEQQKHKRACLKNEKKILSGIRRFGGISTSDRGCVIVQGLK